MGRRLTRDFTSILCAVLLAAHAVSLSYGGDRLAYLHEPCDPYYVGKDFPKLTTPQWVGEKGVEAVVILSIDDMRDPAVYERFLRPILDRLKQIDGRAPVSIFTCQVDPQDARLQGWLDEGLSLEVHTVDHPCPLLQGGDFAKAKSTVDRCIDMMSLIPRGKPVSFRMPCCDSQNTPSPRFWVEIFQQQTDKGNYLSLDSSVFNILTSDDPDLPREIVLNEQGAERFRRYLPFPSFVNTIENYPFPYIIGHQCWQFPSVVPSDWAAQNIQQPNNPATLRDMKLALDATVIKQGVMSLVFHPHGWIRNDQLVDLINHAQEKHGAKVKFLTFREAFDRLNQHLLDGQPIRDANGDTGVRLLDIDDDGYLDVVLPAGDGSWRTRMWDNGTRAWRSADPGQESGRGIIGTRPSFFLTNDGLGVVTIDEQEHTFRCHGYDGKKWIELLHFADTSHLPARVRQLVRQPEQIDDFRFRDLNGDGTSELLITADGVTILLQLQNGDWTPLPFGLPKGTSLLTNDGRDAGLRFRDIDEDGLDDVVFSNGRRFSLHLFVSMKDGWSEEIRAGNFGDPGTIPAIVRADGTNNGAWFHSNHLWVQNEDTNRLPDLVDRLSYADMLRGTARDNDASLFPPAKSPQAALTAFQRRKGVRIELVAAEPDVVDPVAFDWGPDGRLWVAEMRDYPNGITWHKQGDPIGEPGGRIKLLEDTDRDGRYDKVHVFLDKVPCPTGVKAWRKGVIVTAAPDIFYAEDTDGDGRADKRDVLYTGFTEGNQQHRVNGLRWGLDQWLYLANGDSGGTVKSVKTGDEVSIGGRDLRIKPDQGLIETQSGQTQCGRVCDDHGNWFGGSNSHPVWHFVLDDRYLARNPHYAPLSVRHEISVTPGAAPVFPASRTLARFNDFDRADRFTSACSPEVFRDDFLLGEDFLRFMYVCEPVHNLVSRELLEDDGTTFSSRRDPGEQNQEFLASRDNWFRPVMIRTGPDGALWVADMYRLVIEHPEWIPLEWQEKLNLRDGDDRGRIYRVGFTNIDGHHDAVAEWYKLDQLDTAELVAELDSSNGALRDMIQQLLYWRNDEAAIEPLKKLIHGAYWPAASLHALYLLDALDALDEASLIRAVQQRGSVERHAIRLAESRFEDSAKLRDAVLKCVRASASSGIDRRALQQLAYSLGEMEDTRVGAALAQLALDYRDDPYIVAAVMSSVNKSNLGSLLAAVVNEPAAPGSELIADLLGMAVALNERKAANAALVDLAKRDDATATADKLVALAGLVTALERRDLALDNFVDSSGLAAARLIFTAARKLAEDPAAAETERIAAIALLGNELESADSDLQTLLALLTPQAPAALQSAAVRRLSQMGGDDIGPQVLNGWRSYTPAMRQQVMNMLLSREAWTEKLLSAMESGTVLPTQIDAHRRQQLQRSKSVVIRERAGQLFASSYAASRGEVIDRYAEVAELAGDSARGQELFTKHCAKCHRLGGEGHVVGPDLAAVSDKSTSALLVAVLDPNRAVEAKYLDYAVATDDGRLFSGLLTSETANAITLTLAEGKEHAILRTEIEELMATGKSLMPEGIEQDIPPRDMADIFAYVRSINVPPKRFPGNTPQVAPMRDDGSIRLFAIHARIYGSSLVFEPKYRNLGFWSSADDRATWTLNVPRAGSYRVSLDYACPPDCAGNRFELLAAGNVLSGEIPSTGSWDNYGWHGVGQLELPAGEVEVTLRAEGIVDGFLGDFRTIILSPVR